MAKQPRHVLITGGSRGIGLAIAQLFAKNTYRCTLISRSEENLKAAISTLEPVPTSTSTQSHAYISADLSHPSSFFKSSTNTGSEPQSATPTLSTHLPRPSQKDTTRPSKIDVLVNCAGITQSSLFTRTSGEDIEKIIQTNLNASMLCTRYLMRNGYFKKNEGKSSGSVVINVASLLGLSGGYGAVAYAASKAGVLGFTRALATEYASHRVRVNAIVPGYIATEMTAALDHAGLETRIPLGRFGTAEEVAQAALFLAQNEYAHNCVINLDGGLSAV